MPCPALWSNTASFLAFPCLQACSWLLPILPGCSCSLSASSAALLDVAAAWLSAARGEEEGTESELAGWWGLAQGYWELSDGLGAACLEMFNPGKLGWDMPPAETLMPGLYLCKGSGCSQFYLK